MSPDTTDHSGALNIDLPGRKDCDICHKPTRVGGYYWEPSIRDEPIWVGKVWAHTCCHDMEGERLVMKAHWDGFTPAQQQAIEDNYPPWLIGPAIAAFRYTHWFEFKLWILQNISDRLKGLR